MYLTSPDETAALRLAPRRVPADFTALEQRVVHLAASGSERPSTSVEPTLRRVARRVGNAMMARRGTGELADPRLEALRSYAAAVRLGRSDGLAVFHAAGYTAEHADTVKQMVRDSRRRPPARDRLMYAGGVSLGIFSIAGFVAMTGTLLAGV